MTEEARSSTGLNGPSPPVTLNTATKWILQPVIKDFETWHITASRWMSDSEREFCNGLCVNMPLSAWEEPRKHPLYAAAIQNEEQDFSFSIFYFLRLFYIDHLPVLSERLEDTLHHEHDDPIMLDVASVQRRFREGDLVRFAKARFGEDIWGEKVVLQGRLPSPLRQQGRVSQPKAKEEDIKMEPTYSTLNDNVLSSSNASVKVEDESNLRRSRRNNRRQVTYERMDPSAGEDIYMGLEDTDVKGENGACGANRSYHSPTTSRMLIKPHSEDSRLDFGSIDLNETAIDRSRASSAEASQKSEAMEPKPGCGFGASYEKFARTLMEDWRKRQRRTVTNL